MFSYDKLAAKELNDKVYATLYAVQDDGKVVFGTPTPISAAEYAISTFGLYANDAKTADSDGGHAQLWCSGSK